MSVNSHTESIFVRKFIVELQQFEGERSLASVRIFLSPRVALITLTYVSL